MSTKIMHYANLAGRYVHHLPVVGRERLFRGSKRARTARITARVRAQDIFVGEIASIKAALIKTTSWCASGILITLDTNCSQVAGSQYPKIYNKLNRGYQLF
jgi:hypothetical protein